MKSSTDASDIEYDKASTEGRGEPLLPSRIIAVPSGLCTQHLLVTVARASGGLTALGGAGIWIDGNNDTVAEPVMLLLVSGTEPSTRRAVDIVQDHLVDRGEEAMYVLDVGLAQILQLSRGHRE